MSYRPEQLAPQFGELIKTKQQQKNFSNKL